MAKGLSSVQRTMRTLRNQGSICAVVEKWNQHVGPHGIRQDLFGIIDIIVLDPERGVVGVQCCMGSGLRDHVRTLTEKCAQASVDWLNTPSTTLEIWAWRKLLAVRGGKAMIWVPRVVSIVLKDGVPTEGGEE